MISPILEIIFSGVRCEALSRARTLLFFILNILISKYYKHLKAPQNMKIFVLELLTQVVNTSDKFKLVLIYSRGSGQAPENSNDVSQFSK